jgi:hypothetical protein
MLAIPHRAALGKFLKGNVMKALKKVALLGAGSVAAAAMGSANAAIDLTSITGAVTASDITVGVLAIAATLATVYATIKAAKIAISMLRGG